MHFSLLITTLTLLNPTALADGAVQWDGVSHMSWLDRTPLCPVDGESFEVRLQAFKGDLTEVWVNVNDGTETWIEAAWSYDKGPYAVWAATIPATAADSLTYFFQIKDGADVDYYSFGGMRDERPDDPFVIDFVNYIHAPLGATLTSDGGAVFHVWAEGAWSADVIGGFNGWSVGATPMTQHDEYFIARVPGVAYGDEYRYVFNGTIHKPDPRSVNLYWNPYGDLNSRVMSPSPYEWGDGEFYTPAKEDMIIYQLHVGTFSGRNDGGSNVPGSYRDVVDLHLDHLLDLGVTAVMLNPITEFPTDFSAGYNPISQFAVESAYGGADDLRYLIDTLHQNGIAVLLDVIWNHFSNTDNFLWEYSGWQIYYDSPAWESPWGSQPDFDRREVVDYLVNSAIYWLEEFHFDGFRVDGTDFMWDAPWHDHGQASGWQLMTDLNWNMDRRTVHKYAICEQLPDEHLFTHPASSGGIGFDAQLHDRFKYGLRGAIFAASFGDPDMWEVHDIILGRLNDYGQDSYIGDWGQPYSNLVNYIELHDEAWPSSGGQRLVKTIDGSPPHDDEWGPRTQPGRARPDLVLARHPRLPDGWRVHGGHRFRLQLTLRIRSPPGLGQRHQLRGLSASIQGYDRHPQEQRRLAG